MDSTQKNYLSINKNKISCRRNKFALCGRKGRVYLVELQVPAFSKGIVKKEANVCPVCLDEINEAYIRFKREHIEQSHEEGHIHGHKSVYKH
nr:F420H2 dehydrogenase subunit FpoO [Methanosarcina sp. UBA289]